MQSTTAESRKGWLETMEGKEPVSCHTEPSSKPFWYFFISMHCFLSFSQEYFSLRVIESELLYNYVVVRDTCILFCTIASLFEVLYQHSSV